MTDFVSKINKEIREWVGSTPFQCFTFNKGVPMNDIDIKAFASALARSYGIPEGYKPYDPHGVIYHDGLLHIEHVPYSDEGEDEVGDHLVLTMSTGVRYEIHYSIGYDQSISFSVRCTDDEG